MQLVLVDTCVRVRLFRKSADVTADALRLLRCGGAIVHPWTLLEVSLGQGAPPAYLRLLRDAPKVPVVDDGAMQALLQDFRLERHGIGLVDLQLLATAHRHGMPLWTTDEALERATRAVGLPAPDPSRWES